MRKVFLTTKLQQEFERKGYVVLPLLSAEEVSFVLSELQLMKPDDNFNPDRPPGQPSYHLTDADTNVEYKRTAKKIIASVLAPHIERVFDNYKIMGANFIIKPPSKGRFPVHHDWTFVADPENYTSLTLWCPLVDTDESNGTLQVVESSHNIVSDIAPSTVDFYCKNIESAIVEKYSIPLDIKADECVIFDRGLLHHSDINRTAYPRYVMQAIVIPTEIPPVFYYFDKIVPEKGFEIFQMEPDFFIFQDRSKKPINLKSLGFIENRNKFLTEEEFIDKMRQKKGKFSAKEKPFLNLSSLNYELERNGYVVINFLSEGEVQNFIKFNRENPPPNDIVSSGISFSTSTSELSYRRAITQKVREIFSSKLVNILPEYRVLLCNFVRKKPDELYSEMPLHQDPSLIDEESLISYGVWCPLVDDEFYDRYIVGQKPEGVKSLGIFDYEIETLTPEILREKLGKKTSYPKLPLSTNTSINFNPQFLEKLPPSPQKIAILATNEYEGIFRNGGIGTYYQTLSEKLAAEGWYVVLLLCQSQERFGGDSHIPALKHIFSTSECFDVLNLQPMHLAILSQFKEWECVDYENYCALFFAQAIASAFSRSFIYIEFPETLGLGYRTIQAKRAGVLGKNCFTAVTLHSGQEWLHEAHGKYALPIPSWYWQTSHYEQSAFEQADLAFFPSYFLKAKVESYGWKTNHALHLPYFIPEIEPLLEKSELLRGDLRLELNPNRIPLIFFGRLEERKGLITFLEAIQLLDTDIPQKIEIIFIGKTVQLQVEELKHLDSEQYIRQQLGDSYFYHIFSDLYSQEAIQFISQLNHPIVCLTSHQENFPNAALEMGQLPVNLVVSDTGGFREALNLIERKQGIQWFTPSDARSLMQSLKIAISTYSETPSTPSKDSIYKTNQLLLYRRLKYLNRVIRKSKVINSDSRKGQPSSQSLQRLAELERLQDYLSEVDKELFPIASDKLSMLSFEERSYLQNYTKYEYTGSGEIVDLGCWLGSSTIPLAIGLNDNSKVDSKEERIHAYDIFIWQPYMNKHLTDTSLEGKYKDGDSFVEEFIERIHPWNHLIQVYPGDINRIGWDKHPIEFLFIDAMKSWELANSILRNFFPSLIPGLSLVVHQDFANFYQVWIHLIMYRLRDYIVLLEEHPFLYSSKVFRYIKAIPEELLQNSYSLASFSEKEAEAAFDYSLAITPKKMKPNVAAAKVMYFIQVGNVERAKLELSQARAKYNRSEWWELVDVEEWLERADWFKQYR